jgi:hypothetical protein
MTNMTRSFSPLVAAGFAAELATNASVITRTDPPIATRLHQSFSISLLLISIVAASGCVH